MDAGWMQKWFDGDGTPRPEAAPFAEEAWEIARTVAAIDKQLLSSRAVEAFARLAAMAQEQTARRCAEIAMERCRLLNGDAMAMRRNGRHGMAEAADMKADQFVWMDAAICREFGLTGGKHSDEAEAK